MTGTKFLFVKMVGQSPNEYCRQIGQEKIDQKNPVKTGFYNERAGVRTRDNLIKSQVFFTLFMRFLSVFAGYL